MVLLKFTSKNTTFNLEWIPREYALDVCFQGYTSEYQDKICGLMGNDHSDDPGFHKPDGSTVDDVFEFAESWRLEDETCD
ncbi:IgGFc-binding protein-like [Saccoglossus kowalevskii]